jgi:hypothetical protein
VRFVSNPLSKPGESLITIIGSYYEIVVGHSRERFALFFKFCFVSGYP